MARQVRKFQVTIPHGTAVASYATYNLTMPPFVVEAIEIRVPPGPRGEVGFAIGASGQPVLPWNAGEWIIADDERIDWQLVDQITSGAWQLFAYNTGTYDHTLYISFLLDVVGATETAAPTAPIPSGTLAGVTVLPVPSFTLPPPSASSLPEPTGGTVGATGQAPAGPTAPAAYAPPTTGPTLADSEAWIMARYPITDADTADYLLLLLRGFDNYYQAWQAATGATDRAHWAGLASGVADSIRKVEAGTFRWSSAVTDVSPMSDSLLQYVTGLVDTWPSTGG